jgi:hypothetical protein
LYSTTFTDPKGAFALDVHGNALEENVTFERAGFVPSVALVRVGEAKDHVLEPCREIVGRVVDEAGGPLAGVAVGSGRVVAFERRTWTAADGRFVLDDVERGQRLSFAAPGYARRQMVPTDPEEKGEQVFVLARELVITGQVLMGDGKPAYPVSVSAEPETALAPFLGIMTDAEGRFRIPGLSEGRYTLSVDASARFAGREDLADAEWEPMTGVAAGATDVVLRQKDPLVLAGIVVDEKDRALRGARVNLYDARGEFVKGEYADELGRFRIPVRSGKYELRVNLKGMAFKRVRGVASGTEDVILRFAPGQEIRGEIGSPEGYAAGSGSVEVWSDEVHGYADVDRSGGFAIRGLPPGMYEVSGVGAARSGGRAMRGTARATAGGPEVRIELEKIDLR